MLKRRRKPSSEDRFAFLFETYKNRVFGYVLTITHSSYAAEEITQEVFLKLWLYRDELKYIEHSENYLFTIARNKTLNYFRKARNEEKLIDAMKELMTASSNNVEEESAVAECERLLNEAVSMLSPQRRNVYRLSRYEGMSHEQIASSLHLSPNTVKNHMVHALKFIRNYLGRYGVFIVFLIWFLF